MTTLSTTEIGSITYNLVAGIPTGISGLMTTLANIAVYQIENYVGEDISISAVDEKYQPAAINFTISQTLGQMEAQGLGTKSVKLGELSVTKGMIDGTSQSFKSLAYSQLNDLPKKTNYYQTWC
jgi:hypothetical protein